MAINLRRTELKAILDFLKDVDDRREAFLGAHVLKDVIAVTDGAAWMTINHEQHPDFGEPVEFFIPYDTLKFGYQNSKKFVRFAPERVSTDLVSLPVEPSSVPVWSDFRFYPGYNSIQRVAYSVKLLKKVCAMAERYGAEKIEMHIPPNYMSGEEGYRFQNNGTATRFECRDRSKELRASGLIMPVHLDDFTLQNFEGGDHAWSE